MIPSVAPLKLPEIIPFTYTNLNNTSRGKQMPIPPPGKELVNPPTATIAGGSSSKIFIEYIKENQNKKKLKEQKGLSGCSGLFCPNMYLYGHYTVEEKMKSFDHHKGPFALGKITQVPNHRKFIEDYLIEYDDIHDETNGWMTQLSKNQFVVQCLKQGIERANEYNWRLVKQKRVTKKTKSRKNKTDNTNENNPATDTNKNGTVTLSGILEEDNCATQVADDDSCGNDSDVHSMNSGTTLSSSEDSTHCDMNESAYVLTTVDENTEDLIQCTNQNNTEVEDKADKPYLSNEWEWNKWETHDINTNIPGPEEHDRYDGPHGLKPNISKRFCTVLQCLFETTAIDRKFFLRVCG